EELSVALQKSATPTEVVIPTDEDDEPTSVKAAESDNAKAEKIRPIDNRFDFLELFVFTLVAVLVLTSFIFRHSIVDGGSMEGTLYDGEHLIISDLFYTPRRGDIIVFEDYSKGEYDKNLKAPLVKRVIAVGGDTVRVTVSGEVYINGELLVEEYTKYEPGAKHLFPYFSENAPDFTYYPHPTAPEYIECTVPEGELFVMGDHRDGSTDSRVFGTVKEEAVLGKVILRFYPFSEFGKVN
ncbi:MAG: signal peptidase I, partial [Clostridia bacterium]|nr:signal peptidase I [Clostridia bacterium]